MSVAVKNPWKAVLGGGDRLRDANGWRTRAVGVAFRDENEMLEVLLVSSGSSNNSWSLPGGGVEKDDENHADAAARELMEEAGVTAKATSLVGVISDEIKKNRSSIFLMNVSVEHDSWEEGLLGRIRCWHRVSDALKLLQPKHTNALKMALEQRQLVRQA